MSDTGSMTHEDYERLNNLLGRAIEEDKDVKGEDEAAWFVLMAAQRIAFARGFALRFPPVPVPQSLRA